LTLAKVSIISREDLTWDPMPDASMWRGIGLKKKDSFGASPIPFFEVASVIPMSSLALGLNNVEPTTKQEMKFAKNY